MKKEDIKFWDTYYKIRYHSSITKQQTLSEVNFIKKFLPIKKYIKVLDFVCGFGRHSIALAKLGYQIEGFDIDRESIKSAKFIAKKYRLNNINLYVKDSTKFNKKSLFDASICLYSSVGFLTLKQNEKIFRNLFASVKDKGRIILDVMNAEWAIKNLKKYSEKVIFYKRDKYLIKHKRFILKNPTRERNKIELINLKNGSINNTAYTIYLYNDKEIEKKFKENNFLIKYKYGSYKKGKLSSKNQRIIIIADKILK